MSCMPGRISKKEVKAQKWVNKLVLTAAATDNNRTVFDPPYQVLEHLYIGNRRHAMDIQQLEQTGITHIINCAGRDHAVGTSRKTYPDFIEGYFEVPGQDNRDYDMMQHFNDVYFLIEDARRKGGKVLVHCNMGTNRSGLMVIAYCMASLRMNIVEAVTHCVEIRGLILLNTGFQKQLVKFARRQNLLKGHFDKNKVVVLRSAGGRMPHGDALTSTTL
mmetsp:Transcript_15466/g.17502  ORF Transcript_15466/g.17502 Transcript_15466/m.17502 type:complete len:218 (+) Transcript_15466:447-1100(+)|eukprot:CAMPEP_0184054022 /NCGR_PEP_ID=MMETSP0956-20121227/6327_1 /TAXON_ID=627963 /ORGANISM="Aplanochytrium sp, Strain PBS07" /LENGTH=217 /DNA_ID=CAMNT_0026347563 /DNA_START=312 /DNA_END=965 /DNA_ORIENTATION=-